jgi:hypothetical protein
MLLNKLVLGVKSENMLSFNLVVLVQSKTQTGNRACCISAGLKEYIYTNSCRK